MGLLIAFAILSIGVSFLCSILEASLLSLTPSYIARQKIARPRLHEQLSQLKDRIDQPLAAILTLNTVAHTGGATGVGAEVAIVFGSNYLGIASAIMTLLILVLSEIVPKTIGARYWRQLAPALPAFLNTMIFLLKPFIWISDWIMKLLGGEAPRHNLRDEIKALALLGQDLEEVNEDEQRVIANILDLKEIQVRDVMTPRIVSEWVTPGTTIADFIERIREKPFSRYPVIDENEAPLGLVFRYDLIGIDQDRTIESIMKPVTVVIDKMDLESLMRQFMKERKHMFVVYDEYGSWQGLVTLEDVIETIIGKSIMDETDAISSMRRYAKVRWGRRLKRLEKAGAIEP